MTVRTLDSTYRQPLLAISACLLMLSGNTTLADDVLTATAQWEAAGITDYRFTLTKRVMWGATTIVLIEVRNGELVAADHIIKRTNPVPDHAASDESGLRKTIDDLLAEIADRSDFVEGTFNSEVGYPVNIYYQNPDYEEAVDQLEVRDFSVLADDG